MTSSQRKPSWLRAIKDAATQQQIPLPSFTEAGMGSAICRDTKIGRFVSFKRRLVSPNAAMKDGVEWTLWQEEDDSPCPVAAFREPLTPTPDRFAPTFFILRAWLVNPCT